MRQKPQRCKANVEPIGVPALLKAECPPQRVALGSRQHIDVAKTGSNELVEGGEAELHFALDALQMGDLQVRLGGGLDILQEGRLAHTGLAAQHKHAAQSAAGCLNDLIEAIAFFGAGEQSAFSLDRPHHAAILVSSTTCCRAFARTTCFA